RYALKIENAGLLAKNEHWRGEIVSLRNCKETLQLENNALAQALVDKDVLRTERDALRSERGAIDERYKNLLEKYLPDLQGLTMKNLEGAHVDLALQQ
ncbi:hypothetical protein EDD11_008291, partial [Mortierella claussenii]